MTDLQTELAEARAFQLRLAERIAAASEVLSHLAERKGETVSEQPDPTPNDSRPVWELVIEDMRARDQTGRERYGVPLQAGNGRDALRDAYEEALDLAVYLRQAIAERDFRRAEPPVLRPLFEAAVRAHRFWGAAPEADLRMLMGCHQPGDSESDTAERIIRRAAACGVGEEG